MVEEKSGKFSAPVQLLVSVIGIGAMFALGRLVRNQVMQRQQKLVPPGRARLRALPSPAIPVAPAVEPVVDEAPHIYVNASAQQVFDYARKLEYFESILFGLGLEMAVISEQPGEFFGLRIEHDGELYGTVVVQFEEVPGRNAGTEVTVHVKYKHDFAGVYSKHAIEQGVAKEVQSYLQHLKDSCEQVEVV